MEWFKDNRMQTNPSNFQFLITYHIHVDTSKIKLQIDDTIVLRPEPQVNVLGVTLDSKLDFK